MVLLSSRQQRIIEKLDVLCGSIVKGAEVRYIIQIYNESNKLLHLGLEMFELHESNKQALYFFCIY